MSPSCLWTCNVSLDLECLFYVYALSFQINCYKSLAYVTRYLDKGILLKFDYGKAHNWIIYMHMFSKQCDDFCDHSIFWYIFQISFATNFGHVYGPHGKNVGQSFTAEVSGKPLGYISGKYVSFVHNLEFHFRCHYICHTYWRHIRQNTRALSSYYAEWTSDVISMK